MVAALGFGQIQVIRFDMVVVVDLFGMFMVDMFVYVAYDKTSVLYSMSALSHR